MEAIERVGYEFCQTKAEEGVIYAEIRHCPYTFIPGESRWADPTAFSVTSTPIVRDKGRITPEDVLRAVIKGLERGEKEFDIVVRIVLMCVRGRPELSREMLDLCLRFKETNRVVGLDLAGDGGDGGDDNEAKEGEERLGNSSIYLCRERDYLILFVKL